MRWVKLETIIQSKVSQKEKHKYSILTNFKQELKKDGNRLLVMRIVYARQQKRQRCKEQSFGLCGRRRVWDDLRG